MLDPRQFIRKVFDDEITRPLRGCFLFSFITAIIGLTLFLFIHGKRLLIEGSAGGFLGTYESPRAALVLSFAGALVVSLVIVHIAVNRQAYEDKMVSYGTSNFDFGVFVKLYSIFMFFVTLACIFTIADIAVIAL